MSQAPTRPRFQVGEPVWVELATADPERAESFYSGLLGWSVRRERLGSSTYRMCSLDGRDVAGISDALTLHGGRFSGWITYFAVADIQDAVARATAAGGELFLGPRYLPAAGTGAVVIDPFGAVFGLYQGETRAGMETFNVAGALCWNELDTAEPARSVAFYRGLFDFGVQIRTDSPTQRDYTLLTIRDVPVAGVLELDNEWPNLLPSSWITYFAVRALDDAVARVVELGGHPTMGPIESPHGRLHLVRDPGGYALCLVQLRDRLRPDAVPPTPEVHS